MRGLFPFVWPHVCCERCADAPTSAMVDDQGQLVGVATPRTLLREKDRLLLEIQEGGVVLAWTIIDGETTYQWYRAGL